MLIAWPDGDKLAFGTVLDEFLHDPVGVPGLLFTLTDFATSIGEQASPDIRDLRASLPRGDESEGPATS